MECVLAVPKKKGKVHLYVDWSEWTIPRLNVACGLVTHTDRYQAVLGDTSGITCKSCRYLVRLHERQQEIANAVVKTKGGE